jgi:hypothetical protein
VVASFSTRPFKEDKVAKILLKCKDDDFNDITKAVNITFINQRMSNTFGELVGDITRIQMLNQLIEKITADKGSLIVDKDKSLTEKRDEIKILDEKQKEAREEFAEACKVDIINKRMGLIQLILKANHINDEQLNDPEWWENYVEPAEVNEFMASCITKDKKKA